MSFMIDRPNSTLEYTEYLSGGLNTVTTYVKKNLMVVEKRKIKGFNLHTDILWWLSLLGNIFTPRDLSSVIFFTVEKI